MIDGLKLTMSGIELRTKLDERIRWHTQCAADYGAQLNDRGDDDHALLPTSVLEGEIGRSRDQIETLTLIREHIVADEIYLLGEFDLRFADLLPDGTAFDCGCLASVDRSLARPDRAYAEDPQVTRT